MFGSAHHGPNAGMTCARCEQLLMDAMDGTLVGEEKAAFDLHLHHCSECLKKFEEGKRGLAWLEMLKRPQPEPSADLVNRILAATTGVIPVDGDIAPVDRKVLPFRVKSISQGAVRFGRIAIQPRLAMTAAMAFFSLAVTANLFGVHVTQFRAADLKPANLKKSFYRTSASAVRYYDNLRVVYELQSRVRELRADDGDSHAGSEKPLESSPSKDSKPSDKKEEKPKGVESSGAYSEAATAAQRSKRECSSETRAAEYRANERQRNARKGDSMNCINHPDREKVAFCQQCGRPLCEECVRRVGGSTFCEPDLAARIGAMPAGAVPPVSAAAAAGANPYDAVVTDGLPKPGLAALLGFIPGVGAMYNGQLVKGLIHIAVFTVLVSLTDDHGIFGLFVTGWVFYMVIEAYQTAVARRNGTPLPNAFGLNDLGDRLTQRMGGSTPVPPSAAEATYVYTPPTAAASPVNPYGDANAYVAPTANPYAHVPPAGAAPGYTAPVAGTYAYTPADGGSYVPPVPPMGGFGSSVPVGAVWMIGVGIFFILGTTHLFPFFSGRIILPIALIAWGVYMFYRNMQYVPVSDGSPMHRYGVLYAARRAWWIVGVGVLLLLNNSHVLTFHYSWPFFLILAGVWMFLERSLAPRGPYVAPPPPVAGGPIVTPPPSGTGTALVPQPYIRNENAAPESTEGEGR